MARRQRKRQAAATVLIVDDDDDVREIAAAALSGRGFIVLEAANGDEALALFRSHPEIAVVVTDVVMPGMSGFHIARRVKRCRPDVKVLMVSAYAAGLVEAEIPAGGFLAKPFRLVELARAVDRLLQK